MASWSDFKKPVVNIPITLTLISIALAIYFYRTSLETRDPVCYYNDTSIVVYNSQIPSSAIKLLHNDSVIIKENIFLNEVTLWNKGEIPIMPEDVRDTFKIVLTSCTEILDYKIVAQSHSSSNFILNKVNNNTLSLRWKYFDPENAVKFQFIYTGKKHFVVQWKTNIIGVKEIGLVEMHKPDVVSVIITLVGSVAVILAMMLSRKRRYLWNDFVIRILLAALVILMGSIVFSEFFSSSSVPF